MVRQGITRVSSKDLRLSTAYSAWPSSYKSNLTLQYRKGEESSQPGEQPEYTLLCVENARPKFFGHLLAQQVAINHSIDLADGVEPVDSSGLATHFSGNVIIAGKEKALEEARQYREGTVMWTDGSKLGQGNVGAAVSWKDKDLNSWKDNSIFVGKQGDSCRRIMGNRGGPRDCKKRDIKQPQYANNDP